MFYKAEPVAEVLEQGDVLRKSEALVGLLNTYHPYYSRHADNRQFAILTQSCDLVRRAGGKVGARYLTIAPIRPLKSVLVREFEGRIENVGAGRQAFAGQRAYSAIAQFLARLLNNNESEFFYYRANNGIGVLEDSCAMLPLSISLKPEHYETLLAARVGSITDVFQAKLGWLIGQMYSRVGTPDLSPDEVTGLTRSYLNGVAMWLDDTQFAAVKPLAAQFVADNPHRPLGPRELQQLVNSLPKRKTQVIDAVLNLLQANGLIEERSPRRRALRQALEDDPALKAALAGG